MTLCQTTKLTLWSHLGRIAFIALAAVSIVFAATAANAACGGPVGSRSGIATKLPFLTQANNQGRQSGISTSIVGLWHVTYTADGQLFYEAYDQWHSDRTEFENANFSPIESNVCMGVWKKVGLRTVQLNHVGWNFDSNGNPAGTFTINETNTVSNDGTTYQGTFDYKVYDVNGVLLQEVTGTLAATRITAD
ncbi:MAG: hypothetical protein LAO03_08580 [Acidobacteriia bacterium]|nr:hypothetical protein [Terriglobia bacterium]